MAEAGSDAELLVRWRAGDSTAADELFARHMVAVARVFRFKADDVLDDLIQDTFLVCLERRDIVIAEAGLRPFLLGVAYNLLRRHFEKRMGPRGRVDPMTTSLGQLDGRSPASVLSLARSQADVIEALRELPLEQQVALELFYWEDLSAPQIAGILGVPEGTVRSRLRIARDRLREALGARGVAPDAIEAHARALR